jgi:very-short-patch-repair endonuclease
MAPLTRSPVPHRSVPPHTDRRIGDLARRQHGVVARPQLFDLGLSGDAVEHRVRRGWLRPVHRGVYAVGHDGLEDRGRWMAAVLAVGVRAGFESALLSHGSAAALHGLLPSRDRGAVEVTSSFSRKQRPGIRSHRSRRLEDVVTWRDGIPCTTVARTLVDVAAIGNPVAFERAWSAAASRRLLRVDEVERELHAAPCRRGARLVKDALVLDARYLGQTSRSELERLALRMCHDFGLPRPHANRLLQIDGKTYEADLLWPLPRLIVEVDGDETHGSAVARRRDRQRDLALQVAGWRTVRIGRAELAGDQSVLAERLRAALDQPPLTPARGGASPVIG